METDKQTAAYQFFNEALLNPADKREEHYLIPERHYLYKHVPNADTLLAVLVERHIVDNLCSQEGKTVKKPAKKKKKVEDEEDIEELPNSTAPCYTIGNLQPAFKLNDQYKFFVFDLVAKQNVRNFKELCELCFKVFTL